jgi:amino acid transporter
MGVKKAGILQTCITIFEVILFISFIGITAYHFKPEFIKPLFPKGRGIGTIPSAAASTLWAFIGFETASVAAGEIKDPERNVRRSTIFGISIAVIIYMAVSFFAMGTMPAEKLAQSTSPIADILAVYLGSGVSKIILISAIISILGTTVGWLLATARMSYAAGKDKVFPEIFAKVHPKYNTPHISLIISAVLANILLFMNYSKSLSSAFNFIILLATLSYLPMYASTAAAEIILLSKREKSFNIFKFIKGSFVPLLGFAYAVWAIYGSGAEAVMYAFILILLGVPFYLYMRLKNERNIVIIANDIAA